MTILSRMWLALVLCMCLGVARPSEAQTPTPSSPAFGIAQRIHKEATDALAYADLLQKAGNSAEANFQRDIAHRRSYQAKKKYAEVVASRTFGKTPQAAEALFETAWLEENVDKDNNTALQSLKQLHNNFSSVTYEDKAAAFAALHRVANDVDEHSKNTYPDKICYAIMTFLVSLTGSKPYSYWIAIFLFSLVVKLALTPLSNKQYASMKEMQKLQPHIKEVQAKYKSDPQKMQAAVMQIYKDHGVNPVAGCGPLVIQIPIMIALYYTIRVFEFQFSKGDFLWIGSAVSHLYPAYLATDLSQMDVPLLILYALSMYVQQKMTVPADPQAAEQQRMMAIYTPFLSTYFFLQYKMPAAFVLYYLIFNLLSMAQQYYFMRKHRDDPPATLVLKTAGADVKPARWSLESIMGNSANGTEKKMPAQIEPPAKTHSGAKPAARGTIAPKVHPKKKKR